jgi:molecular chaperone DnaK (HSP70)
MNKEKLESLQDFVLVDVCPLPLGIETIGDKMTIVVEKNTPIPCEETYCFTTSHDNQKVANFRVLEGEGFHATECNLLDSFEVRGIPEAPARTPKLISTFKYDANGMLKVSAVEASTGNSGLVVIRSEHGRLN